MIIHLIGQRWVRNTVAIIAVMSMSFVSLYSPNAGTMRIIIPKYDKTGATVGNKRLVTFAFAFAFGQTPDTSINSPYSHPPVDGIEYTPNTVYGLGNVLNPEDTTSDKNTKICVVAVRRILNKPDTVWVSGLFSRNTYRAVVFDYWSADPINNTKPDSNRYNKKIVAGVNYKMLRAAR